MTKKQDVQKIFISHHNTDAPSLSKLKSKLVATGFQCFLAHEDINPGAHDLESIEKEIRDCDIFLYVGSEEANKSSFCQQEVGMAKGLNKKIFTAGTSRFLPEAFIKNTQAIKYSKIDNDFCTKVHKTILQALPLPKAVEKHLKILDIQGFGLTQQNDCIYLQAGDWNDTGYQTSFDIRNKGAGVGCAVKIGYSEQPKWQHTSEKLPNFFTHLQLPFFSRVSTYDESPSLSELQIESLRYLLNDTKLMSEKKLARVSAESVYKKSLYRNF